MIIGINLLIISVVSTCIAALKKTIKNNHLYALAGWDGYELTNFRAIILKTALSFLYLYFIIDKERNQRF